MIGRSKPSPATLGASTTVECSRLTMGPLRDDVSNDVAYAEFPGYSHEFCEALARRSRREIESASALPIASDESKADGWLLDRVAELRDACARAHLNVNAARHTFEATAERLATFPRPMGSVTRGFVVFFSVCMVALFAAAVGSLLGPSVDAYLLQAYSASVLGEGAERFSAMVAVIIATLCALLLMGAQLLAVLAARGRVHGIAKIAFVIGDILFVAGFAIMRLADEFSFQALAVSFFEFALNLVATAAVFVLASVLRRDAEIGDRYRLAVAETQNAARSLSNAGSLVDEAEESALAQIHVIEVREEGVRRAALFAELAEATTAAAYAASVSRLLADEAKNPAESVLDEHLDVELRPLFDRRPTKGAPS